jgi:hypothetical protein
VQPYLKLIDSRWMPVCTAVRTFETAVFKVSMLINTQLTDAQTGRLPDWQTSNCTGLP